MVIIILIILKGKSKNDKHFGLQFCMDISLCLKHIYRVTQVKLWLFKSVILWNGKIKVRLQNKFIKLAIWIFQKRVQKNLKTLFWASKRTFYFFTKKSTGCFLPIFITELKYTYKKWWSFWAPYILKNRKKIIFWNIHMANLINWFCNLTFILPIQSITDLKSHSLTWVTLYINYL